MKKSLKKLNISSSTLSNLEFNEIVGVEDNGILSIGYQYSKRNSCPRVCNVCWSQPGAKNCN